MSTLAREAEVFLEDLAVRVFEKAIKSRDPIDTVRFEAKLEAQRVAVEHGGDLTLAAKEYARKKLGGR